MLRETISFSCISNTFLAQRTQTTFICSDHDQGGPAHGGVERATTGCQNAT